MHRENSPRLDLSVCIFLQHRQHLGIVLWPYWHDKAPAGSELVQESAGRTVGRSRYKHLVERGMLGPASRAVPDPDAQCWRIRGPQTFLGQRGEFFNHFDGQDLSRELGQKGA